jgi:nucleotide-binding universal stress UspA family protein
MTNCRILVPLDGTASAEAALAEAERIAVGGAEVHLLHVVPSLPSTLHSLSPGVMEIHDQALSYLEGLRRRLPDLRGVGIIRTGDPADAIFQVALEFNIDLIAMCTHARTGLARWFMGSVAETVVRRAQIPVLVRPPGLPAPRTVLRRILVPLDGSEESFSIMTAVKRLALRTGAEVVLLHVTEHALAPVPQRGGPAASGIPEDPEQKLLTVADRLGASDLIFWQVIVDGDAVEEILNQARTLYADIIAMSTHARCGRERAIFGSVAQAVLGRADRAVLLQRPVIHSITPTRRGPL